MRIAYSGLKKFIDTDKSPEEISLILTNIGLEVESLGKIQVIPGGLEGLIIGEVISCSQHPNADRLKVTQVNVGDKVLQIVCGASNVDKGQKVVVATVGTTVYPNLGDPFQINKSKIRGEVSEGMICAEDEIGLGNSHDGIMVLPSDTPVGIDAKSFFNLEDDYIFEIGLTPNRADAASHFGVARDIAAYLRIPVQKPEVISFENLKLESPVKVQVLNLDACPRYSGIYISGVQIDHSPEWLKNHLISIGLRPINNVVDITNFVLHELGQPLHAFDADLIKGGLIQVKKVSEGTLFTTLDEVERKLSDSDLMICDEIEPICMAGVFGGLHSGVTEKTKNIFLESAYFNSVSVRKTAKRFGLKTDSSFRFERGTDPEMTVYALQRAAFLISEIAGGSVETKLVDVYPEKISPFRVEISFSNVNKLIGKEISPDEIKSILEYLGIHIESESVEGLVLQIPQYKVDVNRECDVIEEILRIYGYDNIEIPNKVNASLTFTEKPNKELVQQSMADLLSANGFMEIWCNSLTKGSYYKDDLNLVKLLNPLSSDLNVMRQSLLHPGLEVISYNQNRKNSDLKLFEFGKTYHLIEDKYKETSHLMILISGMKTAEHWSQKQLKSNFYHLKSIVDLIITKLGIESLNVSDVNSPEFAFGLKYHKGDKDFVRFGKVNENDTRLVGVEKEVWFADFNWDAIIKAIKSSRIINQEIPKFPVVRRDLSLLIDKSISFEDLRNVIAKTDRKFVKDVQVFDVYEGDKLPKDKKSYALAILLQDEEKTLTDKQIDAVMQKIMHNLAQNAKAEIRKA